MSSSLEEEGRPAPSEQLPHASVVIASRRGTASLAACLQALAAQRYAPDRFDVVIVDDGAPDPVSVKELAAPPRVTVHRQENAGPAAARNAGVRLASGDLVVFTDDDCVPDPDWLLALGRAFVEHPDALLGGTVVNALPDDGYAEATHALMSSLDAAFGPGSRRRFFTSNNMAVPRGAFDEMGGFAESFPVPGGEDRELCERWQADGRPLVRVPDAVVRHAHGMTLLSFVRQHANYGRGAYELRRRRGQGEGRELEAPGFYAGLVLEPFRRLPFGRALPQAALLLVAQGATAAGYLQERNRARRRAGRASA